MKYRQWVVDVILVQTPSRCTEVPNTWYRVQKRNHYAELNIFTEDFRVLGTRYWELVLVLFRHCARQIHGRQQHEDVGLQQRDTNVQPKKQNWDADRDQRKEHQSDHIAGEHIRV